MLVKDSGICIKAVDYSETSQIVTLFTYHNGKVQAIAKGSKRKKSSFEGQIEIFTKGLVVFTQPKETSELVNLTEFSQQAGFPALMRNLSVYNCALFATELITKLTDQHDPHPQLYTAFESLLENIQHAGEKQKLLVFLIVFQLTLLREIGMQPVLDKCVNCKNPLSKFENFFSSSANGLICRDCQSSFYDKIKLSPAAADCLVSLKNISSASPVTLKEIQKVLLYHLTEILGRPPRMAKYILKI